MNLTDTHTHLYLDAFDNDRQEVVERAIEQGVTTMLLPNIDHGSLDALIGLCDRFPGHCFPMVGLHPTSVGADYETELEKLFSRYEEQAFIAIGEIGIDLYWDKTFFQQQQNAFRIQIEFALDKGLPLVIHSRDSFDAIMSILVDYKNTGLSGVFHCFTGTLEEAQRSIDFGFKLGIGGVVTFKNSGLDKVVKEIELEHLVLETDSPFLAPVPFRGKRNESTYINLIANQVSEIKQLTKEEVARATTENANELFNLTEHE